MLVGLALGLHRRGTGVTVATVVKSDPDGNPVIRTLRISIRVTTASEASPRGAAT